MAHLQFTPRIVSRRTPAWERLHSEGLWAQPGGMPIVVHPVRSTGRHGTPQCKPAHISSVERAWAYVVCASFLSEALASSVRAGEEGKGGRVAHRVTSRRNSCSDAGKQLCACT